MRKTKKAIALYLIYENWKDYKLFCMDRGYIASDRINNFIIQELKISDSTYDIICSEIDNLKKNISERQDSLDRLEDQKKIIKEKIREELIEKEKIRQSEQSILPYHFF